LFGSSVFTRIVLRRSVDWSYDVQKRLSTQSSHKKPRKATAMRS
jgi:hypothetical protein